MASCLLFFKLEFASRTPSLLQSKFTVPKSVLAHHCMVPISDNLQYFLKKENIVSSLEDDQYR